MSDMEYTPLREEFFRSARKDPYLAQIKRIYANAWAEGYEQALREAQDFVYGIESREGLQTLRDLRSRYEREEDALEYLTESERRAEELVSLALLGGKIDHV